ncbi:MAG: hypothetical protein H0T92_13590 [Pyrinomonadaceae bacterium]|nr:hypothetical protein [Pyrinomonadaceae bacterium]
MNMRLAICSRICMFPAMVFAQQVTNTPPDYRLPGKIVLAGFFHEDWGLTN